METGQQATITTQVQTELRGAYDHLSDAFTELTTAIQQMQGGAHFDTGTLALLHDLRKLSARGETLEAAHL